MKLLLTTTLFLLVTACAYGPKTEKKSALHRLNGNHYRQSANILGVPAIERQEVMTELSGKTHIQGQAFPVPLRQGLLTLSDKKGKLISQTMTDSQGFFKFSQLLKNGTYYIRIKSKTLSLNHLINVKKHVHKNMVLMAKPRLKNY